MNESPLSGGMLAQELQRDLEDLDLFREALTKMKEDATSASDAGLVVDDRPRLTLVRPEDHEEASSASLLDDTTVMDEPSKPDEDDYGELWLESLTGNAGHESTVSGATSETTCALIDERADVDSASELADDAEYHQHDHSAVEDVVMENPLVEAMELDEANEEAQPIQTLVASASKPAATLGVQRHPVPQRIGSGKLAPTKLNWKPGDPFGCSEDPARRFRWELMLTTACVTAMCGLTCIWLLRTILA